MLENLKIKSYPLLLILKWIFLFLFFSYGLKILYHLEYRAEKTEILLKEGLEQVHLLLNEQSQEIILLKDHAEVFTEKTGEIIRHLDQLQGMQQALADLIDQQFLPLDEKLKTLTQPLLKPSSQHASSHYTPAVGYRIFGVQPYGVVVATPEGRFVIARVGQPLANLGLVKIIGAHKIIVGQFIITDDDPDAPSLP